MTHWIIVLAFFVLTYSGYVILKCHPRLYWGEVGNDLTPALVEFPISKNHKHGGWEKREPFNGQADSPVSARRTFDIFNSNSWARSLHFLAAWILVVPGAVYLFLGVITGHFWKRFLLRRDEMSRKHIFEELLAHFRLKIRPASGGPQYGTLQKISYTLVVFLSFPLVVSTGLTMSPAITADYPMLLDLFGGFQSARTIHFFASVFIVAFSIVHVLMVTRSGLRSQIRAMTLGIKR